MIRINLKRFDKIQSHSNFLLLLIILFVIILSTTIWASLHQNLFTEFSWINSKEWFQATLVDFYINQFFIWLFVCYLEKENKIRLIWLFTMFFLGSMGTILFLARRILYFPERPWKPQVEKK